MQLNQVVGKLIQPFKEYILNIPVIFICTDNFFQFLKKRDKNVTGAGEHVL